MDFSSFKSRVKSYWLDCLFIGAGCLALLVGCFFRGRHLPMWVDEHYSFNLIQDPSLGHMMRALNDAVDGLPPLYYVSARIWAALFSTGELPLRLFSSAMFCAAFVLLWTILRRRWDSWSAALGLSVAVGTNYTIRFENSNIRFYGLFFALIAVAVWLAIKLGERERVGGTLIAANALAQAALVFCHYLGGFYSTFLLLATLAADARAYRRVRWGVALSYPLGSLMILLWLPQLLHQAAINHPHSWVPVPGVGALIIVNDSLGSYQRLCLFLGVACLLHRLAGRDPKLPDGVPATLADDAKQQPALTRLLLIAAALLAIIPFFWVFSHVFPKNALFLPRYLIGASIGWAIVMTYLCSILLKFSTLGSPYAGLLKAMSVAFVMINLHFLVEASDLDRGGTIGNSDLAFGHPDLPIVCLQPYEFLPRVRYSPFAERFYFLLDQQWAYAPDNPITHAAVDYNSLAAIERNYGGLYRHHIVDVDTFLRANPEFLVEDVLGQSWVRTRLTPDKYIVTRLVPDREIAVGHEGVWPLLLVQRK